MVSKGLPRVPAQPMLVSVKEHDELVLDSPDKLKLVAVELALAVP